MKTKIHNLYCHKNPFIKMFFQVI